MELKSYQRAFLRSEAQTLSPVVYVGKEGFSEGVCEMLKAALNDHELVKVRFVNSKDQVREIAKQLEEATDSTLVSTTGFTAVFFRFSDDENKRVYHLS